jgi:hypothetical protein
MNRPTNDNDNSRMPARAPSDVRSLLLYLWKKATMT